jgi:hypothetical protein
MRFVQWDYNTGMATEYRRITECNGCSDGMTHCCRGKMTFMHIALPDELDEDQRALGGGYTTDGKGVWQGVDTDKVHILRQFVSYERTDDVCPNLVDDKCNIYEDRCGYCHQVPMCPSDNALIPECSVTFEIVKQWQFVKDEA